MKRKSTECLTYDKGVLSISHFLTFKSPLPQYCLTSFNKNYGLFKIFYTNFYLKNQKFPKSNDQHVLALLYAYTVIGNNTVKLFRCINMYDYILYLLLIICITYTCHRVVGTYENILCND